MTLVTINASEYGLEESKAKQISNMFKPMLNKMEALEVQFNEVVIRPLEPETIQMAHDLRLAYVKVRTGTAAIHQELKAFYLQGGRFVDGWKNAQLMASQGYEDKLRSIEDHFVNIEKERIAKFQEERAGELRKYEVEFIPAQLGEMDEDVWNNYLSGVKLNYEAQKEAKRKAEEDRIAREKAEAKEQERIRKENIQLKKKAEEMDALIKKEDEMRRAAELLRMKKEKEEREAHEAALQKEREERERIQTELKAKEMAELQAKEEEAALIQAELNKGDKDKVNDLISDLQTIGTKYTFKSRRNQRMYSTVRLLLDRCVNEINSATGELDTNKSTLKQAEILQK